ncbi:mechanosensitive ion channel [Vacuolonema iberomarrocanum]|uniref:mechanosensitive ion channel n=1 Tax=Vacuolonema iberomarrocanum TaxID=3454632 RepID=UPI0019F507E7|nr:mechanosensitive ion channel [filamentous cyanobacterium LEGE 07170]
MADFLTSITSEVGGFLPRLVGAIAILILGWIFATILASITRGLLKKTDIDNRLASMVTGRQADEPTVPIEQWIATAVYWITLLFVLVAFFNALQLGTVSDPLNGFLEEVFAYLPKLGGALLLLALAWLIATISKLLLTRGLQRFRLDERLNEQLGTTDGEGTPVLLNETLANAVYWFVFLFFLPFILDALELTGPLGPVQNLLDDILNALPRILTAIVIGVAGWLIARVVRGIVTNLLAATGADQLGARMGLQRETGSMSLSGIVGTVVYVLVLIPTAIAALNALEIDAISDPAIAMLEIVLEKIPQIITAIIVLGVFYYIGRFVSELVISVLTSIGFNNVFNWIGVPEMYNVTATGDADATPSASPIGQPPPPPPSAAAGTVTTPPTPPRKRTPSEIVGAAAWVAIVLFGAVAATEILAFDQLTVIVQAILRVSARVLSGVVVFGIGLYLANLAFSLIHSSGSRQANILAQAARIAIIALVGAMALQQMGVATSIVNLAFGLLFGAIAVAIALAFGLGGRDVAAEQIREWLASFKQ